jgi:hypothetical protein
VRFFFFHPIVFFLWFCEMKGDVYAICMGFFFFLENHVFLVHLDVFEGATVSSSSPNQTPPPPTPTFIHSIRSALCVPLQTLREMFDHRFIGGSATLERDLAPPGLGGGILKILVVDDGLPCPYDMYTIPTVLADDLDEGMGEEEMDEKYGSWLVRFKRSVVSGSLGMARGASTSPSNGCKKEGVGTSKGRRKRKGEEGKA